MSPGRQFWVVAHRWAGLTIALFMVVVGVTGAIIPWQEDLQRLIAPDRFVVQPRPGTEPLSPLELRRIAEARSGGVVDYLPLWRESDATASFSVAARLGRPSLGFDEIVLDPYNGREIARGRSADLRDGAVQIIPFLYRLHYELALGDWGAWTLGIAAVIWTVDCFVGFYLSLPVARRRWWQQFGKSWRVRWRAGGYKLNFDLHRAGGLWVWPVLLVFAWSSVGMNMPAVFNPVMATLTDFQASPPQASSSAPKGAVLGWDKALAIARHVAAVETVKRGLHIERERVVYFDSDNNSYSYAVRTERDHSDDGANSYFSIDASSGKLVRIDWPTGEHSGNTIGYWLGELHVAGVFGLPYRIFVSAFGIFLAVISVTGVVIWLRKRTARITALRRGQARSSAALGHSVNADLVRRDATRR